MSGVDSEAVGVIVMVGKTVGAGVEVELSASPVGGAPNEVGS